MRGNIILEMLIAFSPTINELPVVIVSYKKQQRRRYIVNVYRLRKQGSAIQTINRRRKFASANFATMIALVLLSFVSTTLQIGATMNKVDLKQMIQHIFDSTKPHDVQLITQDFRGNAETIVEEIHKISLGTLPTTCISFTDSIPENLSLFPLSSGTLMLFLFISKYPPTPQQVDNIARVIRHKHTRPKVLLITILDVRNNDFRTFFKIMWSQRIIRIAIMDLSVSNEEVMAATIHRYNPFSDDYTKGPYSSELELFPKIMNLQGYPIVVSAYERMGYIEEVRDSEGNFVKFMGPDVRFSNILQRMMNFTIVPYVDEKSVNGKRKMLTRKTIHEKLNQGEIEMLMTTVPYVSAAEYFSSNYTQRNTFENWCPVIPLVYRNAHLDLNKFKFLFVSVVTIVISCVISAVLKFESNYWNPTNIFGSIFSVCIRGNFNRGIERVAFVCVFLVSCFCSSHFHADLTSMSIGSTVAVEYETFGELRESGLIPVIDKELVNVIFDHARGDFLKLKEKALTNEDIPNCLKYLLKHKNVTCFLNENMVRAFDRRYTLSGKPQLKICRKLCYWTPLVGYSLYKNLPYRHRMNDIIKRLESSGIRAKWYSDYLSQSKNVKKFGSTVPEVTTDESLDVKLRYVALFGYFIAIVVFLGELAMNRINM